MEALDKRGYLENALVIFTSDHGDMLGDHGLPYKWLMYDSAVNIPLMIRDTGVNRKVDTGDLVSHIDIGPTVLRYAGLDVNKYYEGRSLLPDLEGCPPDEASGGSAAAADASDSSGGSGAARKICDFDADLSGNIRIGEYVFCEDNYLTMARGRKYKLVYYTGQEENGELYDLEADPEEFENLFHHRDYQTAKSEMQGVLLHWLLRSTYRTAGYKNTDPRHPRLWPQKHPYLHGAAENRPDSWSVDRKGKNA
jgi:arylsulfatase A-like enzyme